MATKTSHSSFWLGKEFDLDTEDTDNVTSNGTNVAKLIRLAAVRRGISNFVNILTGESIPVKFHTGKDSYTDGKTIVISGDDNPKNFDTMVGVALHEAAHVLLTDFGFIGLVRDRRPMNKLSFTSSPYFVDNAIDHAMRYGGMVNLVDPDLLKTFPVKLDSMGNVMLSGVWEELGNTMAFAPNGHYTTSEEIGNEVFEEAVSEYNRYVDMFDHLHTLMNILEDRRIDKYVYSRAGGYRPYYDAMYNKYFFTASVGKNLKNNPEWNEPTVENYINRLLLMFHPDAEPTALPGLKMLYDMVDLKTIERLGEEDDVDGMQWTSYDRTPKLWKEANTILSTIYALVELYEDCKCENGSNKEKQSENSDNKEEGENESKNIVLDINADVDEDQDDESGESNNDENDPGVYITLNQQSQGGNYLEDFEVISMSDREDIIVEINEHEPPEGGSYNESAGNKQLEKIKKFLDGDIRKKCVSKGDVANIEALESAKAEIVDISGEGVPYGDCIVVRKLNTEVIKSDWFPFVLNRGWGSYRNTPECIAQAIANGRRMGQVLVDKLEVRNDPKVTTYTRRNNGKIDRRLLSNLGMDITNVFEQVRVDSYKPALLYLTLDASGSMQGKKWDSVVSVATALAYVGSKSRSVDVVITIRGGNDVPLVVQLFDSRTDTLQYYLKNIKMVGPGGVTPEGLAFKATVNLILENTDTSDVYFINFSDGQPSFQYSPGVNLGGTHKKIKDINGNGYDRFDYYGEVAVDHTRTQVNKIKSQGVKVLSYFIKEYSGTVHEDVFKKMYGNEARFIDVTSANVLLKTLNEKLTEI